jgi:dATP pyrophosphohydrolase
MLEFVSNTVQLHIAAYDPDVMDYKFLLLQRSEDRKLYPLMWQAVTGVIEQGEKAADTAIREMSEETGLAAIETWTIPYVTSFFDPYKDRINASPVFGALSEYSHKVRISREHRDYKWLAAEEANDYLILPSHVEGMAIFLKYILRRYDSDYFKYLNYGSDK